MEKLLDQPPAGVDTAFANRVDVQPLRPDYARLPIMAGFAWADILYEIENTYGLDPGQEMYLVVFRSQLRERIDPAPLHEVDEQAHKEAADAPGFLYYFAGEADEEGYCLSFCLWASRAAAVQAARNGQTHKDAMEIADKYYKTYELERYLVGRDNSPEGFRYKSLDEAA